MSGFYKETQKVVVVPRDEHERELRKRDRTVGWFMAVCMTLGVLGAAGVIGPY